MVNKVITLTQLLELVHQKINIESHQHIQHLHFRCPYLSQDNHICTHILFWERILMFEKCSTFFTTTQHYHLWSYLPQFVTTITHQTTNMTQLPMLRTYYMNTRVVGSKIMIVIVTPLPSWKDATCLLPTNQYSNEVINMRMIRVSFSALRFSLL